MGTLSVPTEHGLTTFWVSLRAALSHTRLGWPAASFVNGELVVGEKRGSSALEVQPLDVSGRPMPGAKRVEWIQGKAKPVTKWGNGIVGIAEAMCSSLSVSEFSGRDRDLR